MGIDRHRWPVLALSLVVVVSGVSAFVFVPPVSEKSAALPGAVGPDRPAVPVVTVPPELDWRAVRQEHRTAPDCSRAPVSRCVVVHGTGAKVALIGDSQAQMLIAPMIKVAKAAHWTLAVIVTNGCPWQDGLWRFTAIDRRTCLARKAEIRNRLLPRLDPDTVVLIHAPMDSEGLAAQHLGGPDGRLVAGSARAERVIKTATDTTVARLVKDGRDVVIIEPIPQAPHGLDPLQCLSAARFIEQCRFVVTAAPSPIELHYRALARSSAHVWAVDIDRLVCPYYPICDPVVHGTIVWYNVSHLSLAYARTLAGPLRSLLADAVLDRQALSDL